MTRTPRPIPKVSPARSAAFIVLCREVFFRITGGIVCKESKYPLLCLALIIRFECRKEILELNDPGIRREQLLEFGRQQPGMAGEICTSIFSEADDHCPELFRLDIQPPGQAVDTVEVTDLHSKQLQIQRHLIRRCSF